MKPMREHLKIYIKLILHHTGTSILDLERLILSNLTWRMYLNFNLNAKLSSHN